MSVCKKSRHLPLGKTRYNQGRVGTGIQLYNNDNYITMQAERRISMD